MKVRETPTSPASRGVESRSNRTATSAERLRQSELRTAKVRAEECLALFSRTLDELFWGSSRGLSKIVTRVTNRAARRVRLSRNVTKRRPLRPVDHLPPEAKSAIGLAVVEVPVADAVEDRRAVGRIRN